MPEDEAGGGCLAAVVTVVAVAVAAIACVPPALPASVVVGVETALLPPV